MENIITNIINLCNSNNLEYQIESTGVGYENQFLIWDDQDNEMDFYFEDENGEKFPDVIYWVIGGTIYETEQFEIIEKMIKNKFV